MEEPRRLHLTYVTERIMAVACPADCPQDVYLQGLEEVIPLLMSKHGNKYMLINLSEKHNALTRMNQQVLDTGWVELLAPNLDQMFSVCRVMERWLQAHHKHVLVLHCRGGKDRLGVLLASYIHISNLSASAELSLDHFAMRRFYNNKLSNVTTPSQKRYVWMLGCVLKGGLRMSSAPYFLLCVVLHGVPKMRADGECCLFLRVYQSLQAVCTSAVYHLNASHTDRLYFVLQPAQLLTGDIMVVCYDKNMASSSRHVVFRLQLHTSLVMGHNLTFSKADLDCACEDPRFPEEGKVELLLSERPEKITGRELWYNQPCVTVDYDTLDPLVRRDSYQQPSSPTTTASSNVVNPGNDGLFSKVRKKSSDEGETSHRPQSVSSDSGLSGTSQGLIAARRRKGTTQDKGNPVRNLVPGPEIPVIQPLLEVMTELALSGGYGDESGPVQAINGEMLSSERETAILEDEDEAGPGLDVPSRDSDWSFSSETLPETSRDEHSNSPPPLVPPPDTPPRGISSRDAVQRGLMDDGNINDDSHMSPCEDEELALLTTDVDESIEQLNQLILDLDPTFVPVPTRCSPMSRSASLRSNGLSHKGNAFLSGWKQQHHISDVTEYSRLQPPGWRADRVHRGSPVYHSSSTSPQHYHLSTDRPTLADTSDIVPSTPTFPVSPPTPYVKHFSEFSSPRSGGRSDQPSWTQDSRSFLDGMNHTSSSADGEMFRSDVAITPSSCQRMFGSMCSVSSNSPLPHAHSSSTPPPPPPVWQERVPGSILQPSPPPSLSSPNAHSSPRRPLGGGASTDSSDFTSLLLGNGGLDHSLLEAMEGLGNLHLEVDGGSAPMLPEKRRVVGGGGGGEPGSRSPSYSGFSSPYSGSSLSIPFSSSITPEPIRAVSGASSPAADFSTKHDTVKFVQDTSKFWYKPDISRDQAIAVLKDKDPGSFIVRDSHSFRGAYGLAMKVATPPPAVLHTKKVGDLSNELVRHFLIECTQKGVRLKGCPNEPYFGSLTALVCQHSITPLALPCKLILPDRDPVEELSSPSTQTATNSASELLKQGAACNVWYLGSVELESLTGHQAVQKATTQTLALDPPPASTVVHFKVSAQGITLTDNQRKLFFRRHYAVNTVIFCSLDPQGRKWTRDSGSTAKIFGFVARKSQSETENMCHLFAEHDPEQPASAIVNFVSKVMIGSHKK
ncbi:tensin 3-2 isoform X2 [Gouania willdenowi]|uniref:tensin 3-2 isoform X2 n=2 Tax=Gouania willdenowi TaxID=441366 RepID=UPI00105600EF|nr:tensin-3-like isoform X2 [Gouania willdenowi]